MRHRIAGRKPDRFAQGRSAGIEITHFAQGVADVVVGLGVIRAGQNGQPVAGQRARMVALIEIDRAHIVVRFRQIAPQRLFVAGQRFVQPAQRVQGAAHVVPGIGEIRFQRHRKAVVMHRFGRIAERLLQVGKVVARFEKVGIQCQRGGETGGGLRQLAEILQRIADAQIAGQRLLKLRLDAIGGRQRQQIGGIARRQRAGARDQFDRIIDIAELAGGVAQ